MTLEVQGASPTAFCRGVERVQSSPCQNQPTVKLKAKVSPQMRTLKTVRVTYAYETRVPEGLSSMILNLFAGRCSFDTHFGQ